MSSGSVMASLTVKLHGDSAWPDLVAKQAAGTLLNAMGEAVRWELAALPGGTAAGRASVSLRIDLPDGRTLLSETTLRLLYSAVRAIVAAHGEPWMQRQMRIGSLDPAGEPE